jgi:hypothetical protein
MLAPFSQNPIGRSKRPHGLSPTPRRSKSPSFSVLLPSLIFPTIVIVEGMSLFSNLGKLLPGKRKWKHGEEEEGVSSPLPGTSTTEQVTPSIAHSAPSVQYPATTISEGLPPPVLPAPKMSGSQSTASDTVPSASLSLGQLGPQVLFHVTAKDDSGVDVVFVHGLRGSSLGTWSKGVVCWPRDLLKIDIQDASYDARIITWGYDSSAANVFSYASKESIFGHAETLLEDLSRLRAGKVLFFIIILPLAERVHQISINTCRPDQSSSLDTVLAVWSLSRL